MPETMDPGLCRKLAQEARTKAITAKDVDLQQSYLELAADYETLAETLERIQRNRILLQPT